MTVRLNQIDKVKSSLLTLSLLSLIFSDKRNNFFRESIRNLVFEREKNRLFG